MPSSLADRYSNAGENMTEANHRQPDQNMKSVFQVAYSQKGKSSEAGGKGNLQVSVAQTMARL